MQVMWYSCNLMYHRLTCAVAIFEFIYLTLSVFILYVIIIDGAKVCYRLLVCWDSKFDEFTKHAKIQFIVW